MADLAPIKERLAKCIRLFGSAERANARTMTERALGSVDANWTDLGDWIEHSYSEDDLLQFGQAQRAEGVEAGIKIGETRKSNGGGSGNSHLALPKPVEMAEYCHDRLSQLNDWERSFTVSVIVQARRAARLSPKQIGTLAKIYIQIGGET